CVLLSNIDRPNVDRPRASPAAARRGGRLHHKLPCAFRLPRFARFHCRGLHFFSATVCAFPLRRFALSPLRPVSCLPLDHFGGTTPFDKGEPVRQHNKTPEATPVP